MRVPSRTGYLAGYPDSATDVDGESINNSESTKYGISLIEWMSHYQPLAQRWIYICQDHISTHSRVTHPPVSAKSKTLGLTSNRDLILLIADVNVVVGCREDSISVISRAFGPGLKHKYEK